MKELPTNVGFQKELVIFTLNEIIRILTNLEERIIKLEVEAAQKGHGKR